MPWVLAALVGLTGVVYYESNKKPTMLRYKITFPPTTLNVLGPLMSAAQLVGGSVQVLSAVPGEPQVYLLSVPASTDLSRVMPSFTIPPSSIQVSTDMSSPGVAGMRVGEEYFEDSVMTRLSKTDNAGPRVMISGHLWDGSKLW